MPAQTTNTLGGVNLTAIAQETLDPLQVAMIPFSFVSTNFSDEIAVEGAAVSTRLPTIPTFGDISSGYAANAQNSTTTAVTCTLGAVTGAVVSFSDAEVSVSSVDLMEMFITPIVTGVANDAMDDLLANVTAANFAGNSTVTAANFDSDDVSDLANELTTDNVPRADRSLVLENSYMNSLRKDNALLANTLGSTEAIREGTVGRLFGLNILEYTDVPGNSENLTGFAMGKTALAMAARAPAIPPGFAGQIQNVTDPVSGFTLQLRQWYSADEGQYYLSGAAMWGDAKGDGSALHRIKSA